MFGMIPLPVKLAAAAFIIIGAFVFGYMKGSAYAEAELARFAAKKAEQVAELEKKNAEISNQVVTEYVDRTNTIREKEYVYRDIAQNSVPAQSDLSNGWVYTHDVSALSGDADATRSSDASPSGIKDNEALLTVISNYAICQRNQVQLIELQKWIIENKAAVDKMAEEEKKKK
jgi:hypothetical protein